MFKHGHPVRSMLSLEKQHDGSDLSWHFPESRLCPREHWLNVWCYHRHVPWFSGRFFSAKTCQAPVIREPKEGVFPWDLPQGRFFCF